MEIICLDTTVPIEYYRLKDKTKSFWFALSEKYQFRVPAIVKYEILRGDKKKDLFWISIFKYTPILPFDDGCAEIASGIYKTLKEKNILIGTDDILIAATAIRNGLKIATLNTEHFKRIHELQIITPANF